MGMTRDIDLHDSLKYPLYQEPVTTNQEINNVFTDRNKCLKINKIEGRTIVNLLGTDGDCEDVGKWSAYQSTLALDSSNKVFGSNGIKVTVSTGMSGSGHKYNMEKVAIDITKYYCFSAYVKNGNGTSMSIYMYPAGGATISSSLVTDTTKFTRIFIKLKPSNFVASNNDFAFTVRGGVGTYGYVDAIQVEEITAEDYNNPNFQPSPYVSNDMSVGDVVTRVNSRSKNMINLVQGSYHPNAKLNTVTVGVTHKDVAIPVSPNTTYTVSLDKPMIYSIDEFDSNKNILSVYARWSATTTTGFLFTTGTNTRYICIAFALDATFTKIVYPDNYQIMLNEGNESLPYEPYEDTFTPIQYPYRSIPNTNIRDTYEDGKGRNQIVEKKVLDGSLSYTINNSGAGYKTIALALSGGTKNYKVLKYNNKELTHSGINAVDSVDFNTALANYLFIVVSNADSGWGDSCTPTADEIKAYFYGYKMYQAESGGTMSPYNGTGTKNWVKFNQASPSTSGVDYGITVCPTTICGNGYTPHRLYYQLATPVPTELNIPNLVAYSQGNLLMESDSQSWVRPTITYQLADNEKANMDEVMKGLSDSRRLTNSKGCRVYNNTNISIPTATYTTIPFNCEDFDTDNIHDTAINNTRLTCKTSGIYLITSIIEFAQNSNGARVLSLFLNGVTSIAKVTYPSNGSVATRVNLSTVYKLNANDYIEISVWQDSGSSLNVNYSGFDKVSPTLEMVRVGD